MILFRALIKETLEGIGLNTNKLKVVTQSSVFEYNAGARLVASLPRLTPTSKLIDVKYHWFCSYIDSDNNGFKPISINKIYGKVNPVDIFTKSKSKES